ncbi:MAG TPA: tRNA epoxyqueuosine(34) reductase QueG [Chloroflexia bacterium]|nr:tRNA epoxyqueuosine(34) reductase QueG [Chloroflexia bacterium]
MPTGYNLSELTAFIKAEAQALGFDLVGIAPAGPFEETQARLLEHIEKGRIAGLAWFTAERAQFSSNPANLLPEVRSIISLGISYLNETPQLSEAEGPRGKVARYAWGQDYHEVLKAKMQALFEKIKTRAGTEEARLLVDTARIVDRAVAARAGLGFYGRNTNLINRRFGSYFFVCELLTDLDLEYDEPGLGTCGRCTRCLDACPTNAIVEPYSIYNDRCISYLTIELKGAIPEDLRSQMGQWIFGCDICQEVCPYNKKALPGLHPEFAPAEPDDAAPDLLEWLRLTEKDESFRHKFRGTPLSRPKRTGLRRNIAVALGNSAGPSSLSELKAALETETDPTVREHLEWAIRQIEVRGER